MFHQDITLTPAALKPPRLHQQKLMLKGDPAIEYHSYKHREGTIYSQENRLMIVIHGALILTYGKSEYRVGKNQLIFLKANSVVEYKTVSNPEEVIMVEVMFFSPGPELIKEFMLQAAHMPVLPNEIPEIAVNSIHPNLRTFVDTVSAYLNNPVMVDETLTKIKLLELLYALKWTDVKMLNYLLNLRKDFRPNITTIMEENFINPLSVSQLARLAGRSLSSFRRDFLATYNMPPSQWIRERRLKKAKELLLTTNMTVTDVCYTLGFEHIAHFSRLFKTYFGHSPSKYRIH